ncbi:MAG: succinate dehydrogenase cytochrome b subunit [Bacteroidales bacterium]|nr:succinate dehydrogenase cytochrome b subunit [Bacteroidales bacterium]
MSSTLLKMSSISKKVFMALAGLFLITFLLVHLGINLFILPIAENHIEIFEEAVHFMTTFPLVKIMEVVLFAAFIIHIILGIIVQIQNWMARPNRYQVAQKSKVISPFSRFMIHTGVVMGIFIGIHLANFYFVKLGWTQAMEGAFMVEGNHDFYHMALNLFGTPAYSIFYLVMLLMLGMHLHHAFQSAFQTLGLSHPTYTPIIKAIGLVYTILVTAGFISIPLYFLLS